MKWVLTGCGIILGISHIGMIGMLVNRNQLPVINLPVGDYTSYTVEAGKDGYRIQYYGNDPKVLTTTTDSERNNGLFGIGGSSNTTTSRQHTVNGGQVSEGKLTARQLECIKAVGGGESSGALVGASVGAAVAPALTSIPFVGWILGGWITMFGQEQGAEIGGDIASMMEQCESELEGLDK